MADRRTSTISQDGAILPSPLAARVDAPGVNAVPAQQFTLTADATREYVAGGFAFWTGNALRSLPWAIDDLTMTFGDDLYERMRKEPAIAAPLNIFKASILEDGVNIGCALKDNQDPQYDDAADLVEFCEDVLDDLETDLNVVLDDLLNGIAYGNKVAELTYAHDTTYTGKTQTVLRRVDVKPRRATAIVVDPYQVPIGFLAMVPGANVLPLTGIQILDPKTVENLLPMEKFLLYSFRPEDNDPRGTSILRAAYDPWWRKQQLKKEHLAFMSQFGRPSIAGFTPKIAQPVTIRDANGNPTGQTMSPETAMGLGIQKFQNGTWAVFPDGSSEGSRIQILEPKTAGEGFMNAFDRLDKEMTIAILTQTLATGEARRQTGSASSEHANILSTITRQQKNLVARLLRRRLLRQMIVYNFGAQKARLTPTVSLGDVEHEDISATVTGLAKAGYTIDPSQFAGIDLKLGFPQREASVDVPDAGNGVDPTQPQPGTQPGTPPVPAVPPVPPQPATKPTAQPAPATAKPPGKAAAA